METNNDGRNVIIGIMVGISSMLPGVSGGTVAVLCGVYERLVEDIGHIKTKLLSDWRFIVTLFIGLAIGMGGCTLVLDWTLEAAAVPCMALFFGLILAQIPSVFSLTGLEIKETKSVHWLLCIFGFVVCSSMLFINSIGKSLNVDEVTLTGSLIFLLCGIVVAMSKVAPGISASSLLIAMGMFETTIGSIAHLKIAFLLPLGIGFIVGVLAFARVMDNCLKKYRIGTYMVILGLTVGSLVIIVNEILSHSLSLVDWVLVVVFTIIGIAISYGFTLYGKSVGKKNTDNITNIE